MSRGQDVARWVATGLPPGVIIFVTVSLALGATVLVAVLSSTHGAFTFSLDDPYVHLALAQKLQAGHYGLNASEYSSPSSSILYPFALAALIKVGMGGQWAALALNLCATAVSAGLLAVLVGVADIPLSGKTIARLFIVAAALLLGLNLIGLAFTGLEHALHVADTLACLMGVVRLARTKTAPHWLGLALVVSPLIRLEGLAIWAAGLVVLMLMGRRRMALAVFAGGVLLVGGFCLYLRHLGLPWLPSSVLAKSPAAGVHGFRALVAVMTAATARNFMSYGIQFGVILALLVLAAVRGDAKDRPVAIFAALPVLAHLAIGPFGWFGRYEIYALTLGWAAIMVLYGALIERWFNGGGLAFAAGIAVWLVVQSDYVVFALQTPEAAAEIHLQQYQMHRFAVDVWKQPVAVNDIGWVAYDNQNYVLDLWGLASETARVERLKDGNNPAWMDRLAQQHHAGLAMIYDAWFMRRPKDWIAVARLTLDRPDTLVASARVVTFYATRPDQIPAVRKAVAEFAKTLPAGATLSLVI